MTEDISQSERLDVLLVLALAFERNREKSAERTTRRLVSDSFAALSREDLEILRLRADSFENLSAEEQKIWQAGWLDKIRRRGRTARLDEQINAAQVTEVLRFETKTARELIFRYLPPDIGVQVAAELGLKFDFSAAFDSSKTARKPVDDKIIRLVRRKFLSNFVALEDIYEPTAADRLSGGELAAFVRQLGARETAIACRGISSKESLAVFLAGFNESDAREIAAYITELEKIKLFWVAEADKLVRRTLEMNFAPDDFLPNLGLQLLAAGFVGRERTAREYAAQKMPPDKAEQWLAILQKSTEEFAQASTDERLRLEKRQRIFERLVNRFAESKPNPEM